MAPSAAPKQVKEPFPISRIADRYLLFDVDIIGHCRRHHNICGMLVGTIPNLSQQNVFLGIPLELMPEEARVLVELGAAYIVDDAEMHKKTFSEMSRADRLKWLQEMDSRAEEVTRGSEELKEQKKNKALKAKGLRSDVVPEKEPAEDEGSIAESVATDDTVQTKTPSVADSGLGFIMKGSSFSDSWIEVSSSTSDAAAESTSLFESNSTPSQPPSSVPVAASKSSPTTKHFVTPTTSYPLLPASPASTPTSLPAVPKSYPLFRYLHSLKYYHMPGLRFGCHYNSYPGDPLRYHSHFAATGMAWDDEFELLDVIGGGRLATGTKKAYMIGGEDTDVKQKGDSKKSNAAGLFSGHSAEAPAREVRAFSIEWAAI